VRGFRRHDGAKIGTPMRHFGGGCPLWVIRYRSI
jgi:hypothetical protein